MATKTQSKPHYATRDFKDAGTTRFLERGAELKDVTEGELTNYVAAGLASSDKPKPESEAEALDATLG